MDSRPILYTNFLFELGCINEFPKVSPLFDHQIHIHHDNNMSRHQEDADFHFDFLCQLSQN